MNKPVEKKSDWRRGAQILACQTIGSFLLVATALFYWHGDIHFDIFTPCHWKRRPRYKHMDISEERRLEVFTQNVIV